MSSLFEKFKQGLAKTREGLVDEIVKLVKNQYTINEEHLERIEEILIGADIAVETVFKITEGLKAEINRNGFTNPEELIINIKQQLQEQLNDDTSEQTGSTFNDILKSNIKPFVIMMVGVNGTGKTTTIAKLAKVLHDHGKKVLLAAADTFRAAATEQLEIWARRANVDIVRAQTGADPAAVAYDALKASLARNIDFLIIDTAGRLHTKVNLMEELKKIYRVLGKAMDSAPHEVFLVLDASTGQNALNQALQFKDAVNVTGIVITKLDGTAKGGMVFTIHDKLKLPIRFVGLGETMDDLKPFDHETFVEALFA